MTRFGNCKFNDLKKLQEKLNKLNEKEINEFIEACAKELAARLLAKVIKRTPVGEYEPSSGKTGGTLRRGWTAKTEEEAMKGAVSGAKAYVDSLNVAKAGDVYQIEIINPVHYASYVEYGHRTRNHKGWVQGRFMLTISEQEIERDAPKILERKLAKKLGEVFK